MPNFVLVLVAALLLPSTVIRAAETTEDENLQFPDGFMLGTATASYQVEGGWNASDKGEHVWDWFTHQTPSPIFDGSNGDVACDSYHKYKEDVQLLKDLGANHYRLSLSWSRILPTGFPNKVSQDGVRYYHEVLDLLRANSIEPFVTLFHWDLPLMLSNMGGWTNELVVDWFADYARVVYREYGPKVRFFATINEPRSFCRDGYGQASQAPGLNSTGVGEYLCYHNVLKAHARAYRIYDEEFRGKFGGKVSIVVPCDFSYPKSEADEEAAETDFAFRCGFTAHPIFSREGDYPEVMKKQVAENSAIEGWPRSRLPVFSKYWVDYIRGTADYFALNYYTTRMAVSLPRAQDGRWVADTGVGLYYDPKWPSSGSSWLKVIPEGLGRVLRKVKSEYGDPEIFVMENGYSDDGGLMDQERMEYLYAHMREVLRAIYKDGVKVKAYTVWSLLDNFEWNRGYSEHFGVHGINFTDPERTRMPKLSTAWVKSVFQNRRLMPVPSPTVVPAVELD